MIYLAKLVDAFGWMNSYSEYFDAVSDVHPDKVSYLQTQMLEAHAAFDQQLADLLLHLSPMELSDKLRRVYGNDPNIWLWLSPEEEEVYLNHERLAYHIELVTVGTQNDYGREPSDEENRAMAQALMSYGSDHAAMRADYLCSSEYLGPMRIPTDETGTPLH